MHAAPQLSDWDCAVSVASLGGRTAPGDTLQGDDTRRKNIFVGKFTKNSGETRSDR